MAGRNSISVKRQKHIENMDQHGNCRHRSGMAEALQPVKATSDLYLQSSSPTLSRQYVQKESTHTVGPKLIEYVKTLARVLNL